MAEVRQEIAERSIICSETSGLNIFLTWCIYKEMFVQCPVKSTHPYCQKFFDSAVNCPNLFTALQEIDNDRQVTHNEAHKNGTKH
jgi:hypothetical protein